MATTLETARLLLHPMKLDDVDALLHIFGDPKVMASFGEQPFERERMLAWVNHNLEHQTEHGYGLFSVVLKSSAVLIGDCGLEVMQVEGERVAELGMIFAAITGIKAMQRKPRGQCATLPSKRWAYPN